MNLKFQTSCALSSTYPPNLVFSLSFLSAVNGSARIRVARNLYIAERFTYFYFPRVTHSSRFNLLRYPLFDGMENDTLSRVTSKHRLRCLECYIYSGVEIKADRTIHRNSKTTFIIAEINFCVA